MSDLTHFNHAGEAHMVDVGDKEVRVGDEVVLIGKQGNLEITTQKIAELCDTIPYEILCSFNDRLPRYYI